MRMGFRFACERLDAAKQRHLFNVFGIGGSFGVRLLGKGFSSEVEGCSEVARGLFLSA